MTWEERIEAYRAALPQYPVAMGVCNDRVFGIWEMGQDYRVQSGYYGGYPAGYLRRVKALFPDKRSVLHLFSGKVDLETFPGDTVDLDPAVEPTFLDDAQTLENVPLENYDLILCDPPYSVEDAEHYMPSMVKRTQVFRALSRCKEGTHVVWLDQVKPMYRKSVWDAQGSIGMEKSTNHRFRVVKFFCRKYDPCEGL